MGLFDFFSKKKKQSLGEAAEKWNLMWDLWVRGLVNSPYAELMTYYSEVNNGGHGQYFTNVENNGDLRKEITALERILSAKLSGNLDDAHQAYRRLESGCYDEADEEMMVRCDIVFGENEQEIICTLEAFAASLKIHSEDHWKIRKIVDEATARITHMEAVFDALRADPSRTDLLEELKAYYEGGRWQGDYQLDEAGLLPPDLKRGVLSQDAVYNFLNGLEDASCM